MSLALSYGIPAFLLGTTQVVNFDASVASAPVALTTRLVRLCSNQDCWYKLGADPTADQTSSAHLGKGHPEYVEITPGHKVAFVKDTAAGKASVSEVRL